jgi:hypothetical protein
MVDDPGATAASVRDATLENSATESYVQCTYRSLEDIVDLGGCEASRWTYDVVRGEVLRCRLPPQHAQCS